MKTLIHQARRRHHKPFWRPGGVRFIRPWVNLDVDSDNNGYINSHQNTPREVAEDANEQTMAKPITYFSSASGVPLDYIYVPIQTNNFGVPADKYSFDYTNHVQVYKKVTNGGGTPP